MLQRRAAPVPAADAACAARLAEAASAAAGERELLIGPDLLLALRREAAVAACARAEQGIARMLEVEAAGRAAVTAAMAAMAAANAASASAAAAAAAPVPTAEEDGEERH